MPHHAARSAELREQARDIRVRAGEAESFPDRRYAQKLLAVAQELEDAASGLDRAVCAHRALMG